MSVTEFKRKSRKVYVLMGMAAVLLPAGVAVLCLGMKLAACYKQNQKLEEALGRQNQVAGYVLKQNVNAGEQIEASMLQKVWLSAQDGTVLRESDAKELVGTFARGDFAKGSLLYDACVYQEQEYSADMRLKAFDFMEIDRNLTVGSYIDVRISYPNGEDYIVVNHKKVMDLQTREQDAEHAYADTLCMNVSEEELLRLSSAYVDTLCYPGTKAYMVAYLDQFQQTGIVDYPVNPDVFELLGWNPNTVGYAASQEEVQRRAVLEQNLASDEASETELQNAE